MRDHQETGGGRGDHFIEQGAKPIDVSVIERRIDLIQDADRCRVGQKDCEKEG